MSDAKDKLYKIGHPNRIFDPKDWKEQSTFDFAFDKTLLAKREPLTQAEIDYVNMQLTDAVRKLAAASGCAPEDQEKIDARYWFSKEGHCFLVKIMFGAFFTIATRAISKTKVLIMHHTR